jgi:hypothetical protein
MYNLFIYIYIFGQFSFVSCLTFYVKRVKVKVKVKGKQSRYRPGVAQRVPGSYGSQIS